MTQSALPAAPYQVSAVLSGHTDDVRSLAPGSDSTLFSASRDSTARRWTKPTTEWTRDGVWERGHEGYINAVCHLVRRDRAEVVPLDDPGYLVTAGSDSLIQVYSLSLVDSSENPIETLFGHAHNVCALHTDPRGKWIASASWDMTARIWNTETWTCERVLTEHRAAVWDVLLIEHEDELCLTAAADNYVRLFSGINVRHLFKGHTGPVRALSRVLPDDPGSTLFASASNDGTIRIWDFASGDALTVLRHEDFVYSLVSIPRHGGLASSGEDGLVKIWNETSGECDQVIQVPALSVWSLAVLPNGDLACGCSDNRIWIFTRSHARKANEQVQVEYETLIKALEAKKKPRQDKIAESAVDSTVLGNPGVREGEMKLVRDRGVVKAYQWDGSRWEELGQVVDEPEEEERSETARNKMVHQGKQYDFVFQIDVSDDVTPIPFPYNLEDDELQAARDFVNVHNLPESYVDQIVEFVRLATST